MGMLIHDASVYSQNVQSTFLLPNDFNERHSEFTLQRLDEVSTSWGNFNHSYIHIFHITQLENKVKW